MTDFKLGCTGLLVEEMLKEPISNTIIDINFYPWILID